MPESENRYRVRTCEMAWLPRPGPRRRGQRACRSGERGVVAANATEGAAERAAADPLLRPTVWTAAAAAAADDVPLRGHLEHRR